MLHVILEVIRPTESILEALLRFTWPPKPIVLHVILEVCKADGIHTYEHLIHRYTKMTLFLYRPLKKQFIFYFES